MGSYSKPADPLSFYAAVHPRLKKQLNGNQTKRCLQTVNLFVFNHGLQVTWHLWVGRPSVLGEGLWWGRPVRRPALLIGHWGDHRTLSLSMSLSWSRIRPVIPITGCCLVACQTLTQTLVNGPCAYLWSYFPSEIIHRENGGSKTAALMLLKCQVLWSFDRVQRQYVSRHPSRPVEA